MIFNECLTRLFAYYDEIITILCFAYKLSISPFLVFSHCISRFLPFNVLLQINIDVPKSSIVYMSYTYI